MEEKHTSDHLIGRLIYPQPPQELAVELPNGGKGAPLLVESSAFDHGTPIPRRYSAEGENLSPPPLWTRAPSGTLEWLLLCEDPDAPRPEPFVHWILYNLPAEVNALKQGVEAGEHPKEPKHARQGVNGRREAAYMGPFPPRGNGIHHYHFQIFALDIHLETVELRNRSSFVEAIGPHVLGFGELVGTYVRK